MTDVNENRELGTKPINSLVKKYCAAGLIGLLFQAFQISTDGFLVGNGLGELGLSTIAIVVPLLSFAMAIGCLIGVGGTSLAAIHLGKGEREEARRLFGQCVWYGLFAGVVITILGLLFTPQIAVFLGATGNLVEPCSAYVQRYFMFFPFYVLGCIFYYFVRLDEKPFIGSLAFIIPPLYAEVVEYFCIFQWGVGTASSSTAYGLTVGSWALIGFYFIFSKKTLFKAKLSDAKLDMKLIKNVNIAGLATFAVQMAIAAIAVIINAFLIQYSDATDTAVFGVLNGYLMYILTLIVTLAFAPGLQPIASFNFGAKSYERVRKALNLTSLYTVIIMGIICIAILLAKDYVLFFFIGDDPDLIATASSRIYLYLGLFAFGCLSFVVSGYYQAIEKDGLACFTALCRNVIYLLPVAFLLTGVFGLKDIGVWMTMPVCETLSFATSMFLIVRENKRLRMIEAD